MRGFKGTPEIGLEREDIENAIEHWLNDILPFTGRVHIIEMRISKDAKYAIRVKIEASKKMNAQQHMGVEE